MINSHFQKTNHCKVLKETADQFKLSYIFLEKYFGSTGSNFSLWVVKQLLSKVWLSFAILSSCWFKNQVGDAHAWGQLGGGRVPTLCRCGVCFLRWCQEGSPSQLQGFLLRGNIQLLIFQRETLSPTQIWIFRWNALILNIVRLLKGILLSTQTTLEEQILPASSQSADYADNTEATRQTLGQCLRSTCFVNCHRR